jgi:hypothetical protein
MPRWRRPFRGLALGTFVAAGLLGLAIRAAHADPEPVPDRSTAGAADDADPNAPRSRPRPARSRFAWSLGLGYAYQGLYGVPMGGADIETMLGAESEKVTIGAIIEATSGSTHYGLATTALNVGPFLEAHLDRVRIGGGIRLGAFNVDRATNNRSLFSSSEGVYLRLSVDVFRFDRETSAIFLVAKGSVDSVGGPLYGVAAGAGVRF